MSSMAGESQIGPFLPRDLQVAWPVLTPPSLISACVSSTQHSQVPLPEGERRQKNRRRGWEREIAEEREHTVCRPVTYEEPPTHAHIYLYSHRQVFIGSSCIFSVWGNMHSQSGHACPLLYPLSKMTNCFCLSLYGSGGWNMAQNDSTVHRCLQARGGQTVPTNHILWCYRSVPM